MFLRRPIHTSEQSSFEKRSQGSAWFLHNASVSRGVSRAPFCEKPPYKLESIFPTKFNGHGLLIRDYTELQEGPYVQCSGSLVSLAHVKNPKPLNH